MKQIQSELEHNIQLSHISKISMTYLSKMFTKAYMIEKVIK